MTAALAALIQVVNRASESSKAACAPFMWVDGPLITAMRRGDMILIDEINLAEDAVLERLNRLVNSSIGPHQLPILPMILCKHTSYASCVKVVSSCTCAG
jgi:hypothetical protein